MLDLTHTSQVTTSDPLFIERLHAFLEKSLTDIKAFSERENRPLDETRRHVAEWHCTYLFGLESQPERVSMGERRKYIRSVLCETSRTLESLHSLSGTHSFFLTVDPTDAADEGFLGGTVMGREFWRGLRGGGDAGAKNFRSHCLKKSEVATTATVTQRRNLTGGETSSSGASPMVASKRGPASSIKAEVYANVRNALRTTSGIRTAEMKWSNHDRLSAYGVRLIGWPPSIPQQNPSVMTTGQNKMLLEALADRSMKFELFDADRQLVQETAKSTGEIGGTLTSQETGDISWAYEDKQGGPSTTNPRSDPTTNQALVTWQNEQPGPSRPAQPQRTHQYPRQISPSLSDNITDPASYLLAYDIECINDLTTQHAEFRPPGVQSTETNEGQLLDAYAGTQEPDDRSPKKRRLDEEDG